MAGLPSLQRCSSCLATSMIFGMAIISIHPHGHSSPDAPNQLPPRTCSTPRQTHTPPSFPLSAQLPAYLFVCVCVSVCLQKLSSSPLLLSFLPARLRISYLLHVNAVLSSFYQRHRCFLPLFLTLSACCGVVEANVS